MLVRTLRLKNYRRFKDATVELGNGLVAIIGENGAGKTTIVESLFWALFGSDAGETLRGDKMSVRSDAASIGEGTVVTVEFEIGGGSYTSERSMNPKGAVDAKLTSNGKLIAKGNDEVTREVRSKLGMDWDSFRKSVYSPQKELDALSDLQPKKRGEFISRLLEIDVIDKVAIPGIRRRANELEFEAKGVQGQAQGLDEERLKESLKNAEASSKEFELRRARLSREMDEAQRNHNAMKGELETMTRKREGHEGLSRKLIADEGRAKTLNAVLQSLTGRMDELVRAEREIEGLKGVDEEYDKTKREVEILERTKERQQSVLELRRSIDERKKYCSGIVERMKRFAKLEEEENRTGDLRSQLDAEKEACEGERRRASSEFEITKRKKADIRKHMEQVTKLGPQGECPTCGRRLEEHFERLMANFEKDAEELEHRMREAEVTVRDAERTYADISKRGEALKRKEDALSKRGWELQRLEKEKASKESELEGLAGKLKEAENAMRVEGLPGFDKGRYDALWGRMDDLRDRCAHLKELRRTGSKRPEMERDISEKNAELKKAKEEIERVQGALDRLGFDQGAYDMLREKSDAEKERIDRLKDGIHEIEKGALVAEKDQERIRGDLQRLSSLRERGEGLVRELEVVRTLEGQMLQFWQYLLSRIRPSISEYTSSLLAEVSDYARVELDDGYNMLVYREGEPRPVRQFSGGEQDLMNLCLRLALSRIMTERRGSEVDLVILDEVFASLDEARRTALLSALNTLSSKFTQVILITHIDNVKESVGSHIIVRRSGEASVIEAR